MLLNINVIESTLTDGSKTSAVHVGGDEQKLVIECTTKKDALMFADKLTNLVVEHTIESVHPFPGLKQ